MGILAAFDLKQHVKEKMRKNNHTLDLAITRSDDSIIKELCVQDAVISDHHAIHCDLLLQKPQYTKKIVKFRKIRHIDINRFTEDILDSTLFKQVPLDSNIFAVHYDSVLQSLLERHASLITKLVTICPSAPCYTLEVKEEKTKRRRLERKWLATAQQVHHDNYMHQCVVVNNLINSQKSSYYTSIIQEHSADQKILFSTVNKLLQKKTMQHYPSTSSSEVLANNFADFFSDKIVKIHRGLAEKQITDIGPSPHLEDVCSVELSEFNEVSEDNVRMLACKPLLKSC